MSLPSDLWTLGGKPDKNLLGRSIIIHGGIDEYKTQPTGNAGTRIGCGVIKLAAPPQTFLLFQIIWKTTKENRLVFMS